MAALARGGAESRGLLVELHGTTSGNTAENKGTAPEIDTTVPRKVKVGEEKGGTACYKIAANGAERALHFPNWIVGVKERWYYFRVCVKKTGTISAQRIIVRFYQTEGEVMASADATGADKLIFKNGAGTEVASVENGLNEAGMTGQGGYHVIEAAFWVSTGAATNKARFWLDGVEVHKNESTFVMSKANNPPAGMRIGFQAAEASGPILYFDDMGINDETGTKNNERLGTATVLAHLNPESDKGREGWKAGAGGTTELFKAVDRAPEGLVNASKTNTSQIFDSESSTVHFYESTLATYTSVGVGSSDVIKCARVVGYVGRTTGNVKVAFKGISNPEITEVEYESLVTAEAYPTGWRPTGTGYTDEPAPTLGTGPVIKVRKAQASTNIIHCCYMALQVEWEPKEAAGAGANTPGMLI